MNKYSENEKNVVYIFIYSISFFKRRNCHFNTSVTMTPIKRRKRQKLHIVLTQVKLPVQAVIISMSSSSDNTDIATMTRELYRQKQDKQIVHFTNHKMSKYCNIKRY